MAWVVGVISVGPPSGVDPAGKMWLRISNKQTKETNSSCKCILSFNLSEAKSAKKQKHQVNETSGWIEDKRRV